MDSRIGLDYIVENKEYTAKLGSGVKFLYSIEELHLKLLVLRNGGENGIQRVAVECVDMLKNTGGESDSLAFS